jgi:hypothetical protein
MQWVTSIQEVGFSGCRVKSGMAENFGFSNYKYFDKN